MNVPTAEEMSLLAAIGLPANATINEAKNKIMWGTYGRPVGDLRVLLLCDLDTEHLENILTTERHIPQLYSRCILSLLKDRYGITSVLGQVGPSRASLRSTLRLLINTVKGVDYAS